VPLVDDANVQSTAGRPGVNLGQQLPPVLAPRRDDPEGLVFDVLAARHGLE
jgi:hypothetical protein